MGVLVGVVKLFSNKVGSELFKYVEVWLGSKDSYWVEVVVGDDINIDWGYWVVLVYNCSDGFVENIYLNRDDINNIDEIVMCLSVEGNVDE